MEHSANSIWSLRASSRGRGTLHQNARVATISRASWKTAQCVTKAIEEKMSHEESVGGSSDSASAGYEECNAGNPIEPILSRRDEFWWTARISRHTKHGEGRKALDTYREMREAGVKLGSYTYVAVLKACRCLRELGSVRQIHAEVVASGFEADLFVGNMLVDVYAKCGSLVDARRVFEKMPSRSVVSWNAMILGYAQSGDGAQALQLYEEMQGRGVAQDDRTFVAALKACSNMAKLEEGNQRDRGHMKARWLEHVRAIHVDIVKSGSESALFVGNMLVDVYAKCGSLVDARRVFEKMSQRDVVSWTAMISGYAHMAEGEAALQLFRMMQNEGVTPNDRTFVGALKACSSLAAFEERITKCNGKPSKSWCLDQARAIHSDVVKCGYESAVCVGNILVDVYAKCGSLLDARRVFDKMTHRDVVSWNSMILGYAQREEGEEALQLFALMQQEGVEPDDRTFVAALKACSSLVSSNEGNGDIKRWCLEKARAIDSDVVKRGCETAVFVGNMLVDVYCKCGSLDDGRRVFEMLPDRDVVSWNAMISGYAQQERGVQALHLYAQMQQEGIARNDRTFIAALKACSSLVALEKGGESGMKAVKERWLEKVRAIHSDAEKMVTEPSVFLGNVLVDVYSKCGSLVDARRVFESMPNRNVVSWTAMILGYAAMDDGGEALQLYTQMKKDGVTPDSRAFVGALKACSSLTATEAWTEKSDGKLWTKKRCLQLVRDVHSDVLNGGSEADLYVCNILVDVYAKCGSLEDGRRVFEAIPHRDVVSWNAMIVGYAQLEQSEEALYLYARMQQEGVAPNHRTFVGALMACGSLAELEKGREVHAQLSQTGVEVTDPFVASSLIDMYGKCGSMTDAQLVFDAASATRDSVTWNALISGYSSHGATHRVFQLLERMKQEGLKPEGITFLHILSACSHGGLVEEGQQYLELMATEFGITPSIEHYTCMVNLLGRAGHLDKAMAMAEWMPFQADGVVWETVLGACRKWRNVEVGERAFQCAVRSERCDSAPYVLMSNIYADASMWEAAKEVQAWRMQAGAWKQQPGQSRSSIDGVGHSFVVDDRDHPEMHHINVQLRALSWRMEEEQETEQILGCRDIVSTSAVSTSAVCVAISG